MALKARRFQRRSSVTRKLALRLQCSHYAYCIMHRIVSKSVLSPNVTRLDVEARRISEIRQPGQFVIVHRAEGAERIPLTIADGDPSTGLISLVIQAVGKSTKELVALEQGEAISGIAGRWGIPQS